MVLLSPFLHLLAAFMMMLPSSELSAAVLIALESKTFFVPSYILRALPRSTESCMSWKKLSQ